MRNGPMKLLYFYKYILYNFIYTLYQNLNKQEDIGNSVQLESIKNILNSNTNDTEEIINYVKKLYYVFRVHKLSFHY